MYFALAVDVKPSPWPSGGEQRTGSPRRFIIYEINKSPSSGLRYPKGPCPKRQPIYIGNIYRCRYRSVARTVQLYLRFSTVVSLNPTVRCHEWEALPWKASRMRLSVCPPYPAIAFVPGVLSSRPRRGPPFGQNFARPARRPPPRMISGRS